jgi:hypothetical protein
MRKQYLILLFILPVTALTGCCNKKEFQHVIKLEVINQVALPYTDLPVIIDLHQLINKYPLFNPSGCIIKSGNKEIPFQINDTNYDGKSDELVFLADFKPSKKRTFCIMFNEKGTVQHNFPKRTQAEISHKVGGYWENRKYIGGEFKNVDFLKVPTEHTDHSFFIRYEGPGWESDKVGYRFYLDWRNAIDIFGKLTDTMVLHHVGLDGFDSYHEPGPWGMDIFKVGNTLGLGSIAFWQNDKFNMVSVTDSVTCGIILNGCVESMIETNYYGWKVDQTINNLNSKLSIYAGSRVTKHDVQLHGDGGTLCTGLIKDKRAKRILPETEKAENGWTYIATWGLQSLNNDSLGIAVLFNSRNLITLTEDSANYIAILKPENNQLTYYFLAAWEKEPGGIKTESDFKNYLNLLIAILNKPLIIKF